MTTPTEAAAKLNRNETRIMDQIARRGRYSFNFGFMRRSTRRHARQYATGRADHRAAKSLAAKGLITLAINEHVQLQGEDFLDITLTAA